MTKDEADRQRDAWRWALQDAARKLGYKGSMMGDTSGRPIIAAMGSIAWGRFHYESMPDERKDHVVEGLGYLQGVQRTLMLAARAFGDAEADRIICKVPDVVRKRLR